MAPKLTKGQIIGISVGCGAAVALALGLGLGLGLNKSDEEQQTTPSSLTWSCDPSSPSPSKCVQVGGQGEYATEAECKCWACDGASTDPTRCAPVSQGAIGTAATQDACMCVYAMGAAGPDCECKYDATIASTVPAEKRFHDVDACSKDISAKCGWKYTSTAYGAILQCADLSDQYYLVDEATQTMRLLTETTGPTYDPQYKSNAVHTDCGYYGYQVGQPAPPASSANT